MANPSRHVNMISGVENLAIRQIAGGVILPVKAVPGASSSRIVGVLGDCLKVAVAAAPEKGKANAAIAELIAKKLKLPKRGVTISSGTTNPRKEFLIVGMDAATLRTKLAE